MGTSDDLVVAPDAALDALEDRGCALLPGLLPPAATAELRALTSILPDDVDGTWVSTATVPEVSPAQRRELDLAIRTAVVDHLAAALPGWTPFMASMFDKGPGAPAIPFHQDLTFTDEPGVRSVVAWIPLVDVDDDRGALVVVAGSHRWTDGVRAMGSLGVSPLTEVDAELRPLATTVTMALGSVLLFDCGLAHGSTANRSDHSRPAVAINLVPGSVAPTIWHRDRRGNLEQFSIGDDYLAHPSPFRSRPADDHLIRAAPDHEPSFAIPDGALRRPAPARRDA